MLYFEFKLIEICAFVVKWRKLKGKNLFSQSHPQSSRARRHFRSVLSSALSEKVSGMHRHAVCIAQHTLLGCIQPATATAEKRRAQHLRVDVMMKPFAPPASSSVSRVTPVQHNKRTVRSLLRLIAAQLQPLYGAIYTQRATPNDDGLSSP